MNAKNLIMDTLFRLVDIDVMVMVDEKKIDMLIRELEAGRLRFDSRFGKKKFSNFYLLRFIYTPKESEIDIKIDIAIAQSSFYKDVFVRKRKIKINNKKLNFISCEDLVVIKILSGRIIDISDAKELLLSNIENIDKELIKNIAKSIHVNRKLISIANDVGAKL